MLNSLALLVIATPPIKVYSATPKGQSANSGFSPNQVTYPGRSIGGLIDSLNDLLQKPDSRLVYTIAGSRTVWRDGRLIQQYGDYDVSTVQMLSDGCHFQQSTEHTVVAQDGSQAAKNSSLRFDSVDPGSFQSISVVDQHRINMAVPGSYVVEVQTSSDLEGQYSQEPNIYHLLYWNSLSRKPNSSRLFRFGFVKRSDAETAKRILEDIKKRAEFEKKVKELPEKISFAGRSDLYDQISKELWRQGTKVGFYGAASSTTLLFCLGLVNDAGFQAGLAELQALSDPFGAETASSLLAVAKLLSADKVFSTASANFMSTLSRGLAQKNTDAALNLLRFGALTPQSVATRDFEEIDQKMVDMEQDYAESQLNALGGTKAAVVSNVNQVLSNSMDNPLIDVPFRNLFKSFQATEQTRKENGGKIDYGSIADRKRIGLILCQMLRIAGG